MRGGGGGDNSLCQSPVSEAGKVVAFVFCVPFSRLLLLSCCFSLLFFKINVFKIFFQEYNLPSHWVKQFGLKEQAQYFIRPDLDPNCLQRLSADDTSMQSLRYI